MREEPHTEQASKAMTEVAEWMGLSPSDLAVLFEAARRTGDTAMGEDTREQIPDSAAVVPTLDTQHTGVKGVRGSGHPAWPCDLKETT